MSRKIVLIIVVLSTAVLVESLVLATSLCRSGSSVKSCVSKKNAEDSIFGKFQKIDTYDSPKGASELSGENPASGFVPDQKTATRIAELVWLPIYGKSIYNELPFNAILLKDSVWIISGSLKKGFVGGSVTAVIRKSDGRILNVAYYK